MKREECTVGISMARSIHLCSEVSRQLTNLVCILYQTHKQIFFFSASSFYPGRGDTGNTFPPSTPRPPSTPVLNRNIHADGIDDDSEVEKEGDWHSDESGPEGSAPQQATRFSEALAIEVCLPLIVNDLISMLIS
jgi:hypothetical protein